MNMKVIYKWQKINSKIRQINRIQIVEGAVAKSFFDRIVIWHVFHPFSELEFKKGETIHLLQLIDENWIEGEIHDQIGIFPISYIEVGSTSFCFQ